MPPLSTVELLPKIGSSRPAGIDPAWDCAWRRLAFARAQTLVRWSEARAVELHDALELSALCGEELELEAARVRRMRTLNAFPVPATTEPDGVLFTVHVSPSGDDTAEGTLSQPLRTLHAALDRTRTLRRNATYAQARVAIQLGGGTYHMSSPPVLTPQDSLLTIRGAAGVIAANGPRGEPNVRQSGPSQLQERAVLSGGVRLDGLVWSTHSRPGKPDVNMARLSPTQLRSLPRGIPALRLDGKRAHRARYPNANPEVDLFPNGWVPLSKQTAWHAPEFPPYNVPGAVPCEPQRMCGNSTQVVARVDPAKEWHGMYQDFHLGVGGACSVYDPPVSPWCSSSFYSLRILSEMHTRSPSGLTTDLLPNAPYANPSGAEIHAWRPFHWYTWMWSVGNATFNNARYEKVSERPPPIAPSTEGAYGLERGGFASGVRNRLQQPTRPARAHRREAERRLAGMLWPSEATSAAEAAAHAGVSPEAAGADSVPAAAGVSSSFFFTGGGNQGAEGNERADEWFIENVFEELDAPGEFFFDAGAGALYVLFNTSAPPSEVVVPTLATLIELRGAGAADRPIGRAEPATSATVLGVVVSHLDMRDTRPTYMEPRANPSGGDWALERSGALLADGSDQLVVDSVRFLQLDSNGVLLSGYNRAATVAHCEFSSLGQSAVASWGFTDGMLSNEGLRGDFPRGTSIVHNWCHDIGLLQKQSSFYFQAITAEATVGSNVIFNVPRAAVNFNDGFGGGSRLQANLMFNTCRESGDHGAFNSWDRLPYVTDVRQPGVASTLPAWNDFERNFIVSNYGADGGCFDNDDGSSFYELHHNLCVFGGFKSDFDGNRKLSHHNLYVYPKVYGAACFKEMQALPPDGCAEGFYNNTCVLNQPNGTYFDIADSACPGSLAHGMRLGNNTILVPGGAARVSCGHHVHDAAAFAADGYDHGTTISGDVPTVAELVEWAETLLGMN